jgi:hypothetical protein
MPLNRLLIALLLALLFSVAAPAGAEPVAPADLPQPESVTESTDIPSEKVSQFVQAYVQVVGLIDQREAELQQAETEAESRQIQQSIQAEAFRLIEDQGLTLTEYVQLLGLANRDPDFRDRILAAIEEVKT